MKKHTKKMIAPIIISILVILYLLFYFTMIIETVDGIAKILLAVIPVGFALLMIYILLERIQEIKGGNEDDLGKY